MIARGCDDDVEVANGVCGAGEDAGSRVAVGSAGDVGVSTSAHPTRKTANAAPATTEISNLATTRKRC